MKIGIDIDGVILDFFESYLGFYNQRCGTDYKMEEWVRYNFSDSFGISEVAAINLADELFVSERHDKMPLVEGARDSIYELSKNHDLCIVTSRSLRFRKRTKELMEKHFYEIDFPIFYSDEIDRNHSVGKAGVCKREGVDVLIEDNLEYVVACSNAGIHGILLDKPWNQGHCNGVVRVSDWRGALKEIDRLNYGAEILK